MRNSPWLAVLALSVLPGAAWCADTPAQQLTKIEAETALLKARERKIEVQAQIAGKQAEIASKQAEAQRVSASQGGQPVLRGIEGIGDTVYATLDVPHQGQIDVHAGDTVAGYRVVAVKPDHVMLEGAKKRRLKLGLVAPAATAASLSAVPEPAAMPPLPALPALPAPSVRGSHQ